jgi:hypothetical protein
MCREGETTPDDRQSNPTIKHLLATIYISIGSIIGTTTTSEGPSIKPVRFLGLSSLQHHATYLESIQVNNRMIKPTMVVARLAFKVESSLTPCQVSYSVRLIVLDCAASGASTTSDASESPTEQTY